MSMPCGFDVVQLDNGCRPSIECCFLVGVGSVEWRLVSQRTSEGWIPMQCNVILMFSTKLWWFAWWIADKYIYHEFLSFYIITLSCSLIGVRGNSWYLDCWYPLEVATLARHFSLNCGWKLSLSAMSNHGRIDVVVGSL